MSNKNRLLSVILMVWLVAFILFVSIPLLIMMGKTLMDAQPVVEDGNETITDIVEDIERMVNDHLRQIVDDYQQD